MCGIVAVRSAEPVAPFLLSALKLLEYRGYDSAGVSIRATDGRRAIAHTTNRVGSLEAQLAEWPGAASAGTGIGHTRWATHGAVSERNAHPHADCTGRLGVVHNGIVENAEALRAELEGLGHVFTSEVDSEVIGHLVEDALRAGSELPAAVTAAVGRLEGSWAIVVFDSRTDRMVAATRRSPLLVARSVHGVFAASDINAISAWVPHFQAMGDDDVVELGAVQPGAAGTGAAGLAAAGLGTDFAWSRDGHPSTPPPFVDTIASGGPIGFEGHPDFMSKEIAEQPEVAARIIDDLAPGVLDGSLWRSLALPAFSRVAVLGCGTSLNAGQVVATAFRVLGSLPGTALIASEAASSVIEPGTLVLAFSQSGETADVLTAVSTLDLTGSSLVAVTNSEHSTLARRANSVLACHAGPEIGVAATKTFVAQVVTGVLTALSALVATERIGLATAAAALTDLHRVPDRLAQAIAVSRERIPSLIGGLRSQEGFLFLGRGSGVVFAAEGALKLKELSYRWAEHYPAGELKHGPLALVERGTPVVVIDSGDPGLESSIAEVTARGASVIRIGGPGSTVPALGLSTGSPSSLGSLFSSSSAGSPGRWGPLEAVVPLQILARELASSLGRDVDKPRNLAKSVTVA